MQLLSIFYRRHGFLTLEQWWNQFETNSTLIFRRSQRLYVLYATLMNCAQSKQGFCVTLNGAEGRFTLFFFQNMVGFFVKNRTRHNTCSMWLLNFTSLLHCYFSIQLNKYTFCLLWWLKMCFKNPWQHPCRAQLLTTSWNQMFLPPQFLEKTLPFRNGHHETIQAAVVEELPPAGEWRACAQRLCVLIRCKRLQLWTVRDGYIYRTPGLCDCSLSYSLMQHYKYTNVSYSIFCVTEYVEHWLWNCLTSVKFGVSAQFLPLLLKEHSHTFNTFRSFFGENAMYAILFLCICLWQGWKSLYVLAYTLTDMLLVKRLDHFCLQSCL